MFYLFLITIISVLYYYRRVVFLKALSLVLWICKWKIERRLKRMQKTLNKMTHKNKTIINNAVFTEYDVTFNEKEYNVVFFMENDVVEFRKSIGANIDKRNFIVHASITDDMGEVLFDITDDLRRFSFYFDRHVQLNGFFDFLQQEKKNECVKLTDYNVMLYMNDDVFTEKVYKIKEVYSTSFKKIFFDHLEDKYAQNMPIMEDLD